nr:putative germin-like protein 2-1 [Ipomoea batatas]
MANLTVFLIRLVALTFCGLAMAFEPSPLQDFCVADPSSSAKVNGFACKDPKTVQATDFFFSGLHLPGNTSNPNGSKVTAVNHASTEFLHAKLVSDTPILLKEEYLAKAGALEVGFVTSNPDNRLISRVLKSGDVFVFPVGLVHFQRNVGYTKAVAFAGLSSQNPGVITIANAVFGSDPAINGDVLAKAFQVDKNTVSRIQSKF